MLVVETIAKIRRAFFKQGKPIKAICRELGVSRKVVRRVIRSGATEFRYQREDQPCRRLGAGETRLIQLLAQNEAKSSRERLTLIKLFEGLRAGVDMTAATTPCAAMLGVGLRNARKQPLRRLAAELCSGRSLSVRLEPRDCLAERSDGDP